MRKQNERKKFSLSSFFGQPGGGRKRGRGVGIGGCLETHQFYSEEEEDICIGCNACNQMRISRILQNILSILSHSLSLSDQY